MSVNVEGGLKIYVFGRISSYFEIFLSKSYVLDHSESIDMQIKKKFKKTPIFFSVCIKPVFAVQKVTEMSATIRFFGAFPYFFCQFN